VKIPDDGWGSGYPGDEVTKRFLRKNIDPVFGFPNIVRDSWSTASELLETRAVKIKWEVEEDDAATGPPKITKFFAKSAVSKEQVTDMPIALKKAQFFSYRNLCQTENLF
jgi:ribonuclease H2 subunit A